VSILKPKFGICAKLPLSQILPQLSPLIGTLKVRIAAESRSISFIPLLNSRSTILVVLDTKGTRLHYVPGDHVAIYPQYNAKLVSELLDRLTLPCGPDDPIYVECRREPSLGGLPTWSEERRLPVPITLREAFTYHYRWIP